MKLSVIVPTYNEERQVVKTFKELDAVLKGVRSLVYEIIFVDDGSTDKSTARLKKIRSNKIRVLRHPYNQGYGAALKTGIRNSKHEWILITDSDGTYPAKAIPKLLSQTGNYDMVVGARTKKGAHIPILRRPPKWFLRKLAGFLTGHKIPDLNSGLRVFRKKDCERFWKLYPSGFSFTTTITMAYFTNDLTVKYIPINYFKRVGSSSIHPIKDTVGFFILIFRMIMYFHPLRFFTVPALAFFILFLVSLWYNVFVLKDITDTTTLLLVTSFQIFFLGLIADLIIKRST